MELPLLTLKMDIYHTGKEDATDDHKFINERLLEVAIPPEPDDGTPVTLEDCLELYFNNKIEVRRYLERSNTITSMQSFDSTSKSGIVHVESVEVGSEASSPISPSSPLMESNFPLPSLDREPTVTRTKSGRRDSIIQKRFIPDSDDDDKKSNPTTPTSHHRRKGAYRREVMMPAWQFFSLIRMLSWPNAFVLSEANKRDSMVCR